MTPSWDQLRTRLAGSRFRSRFKLADADRAYVARAGWETLRSQAETIVRERLARGSDLGIRVRRHANPADEVEEKSRAPKKGEQHEDDSHKYGIDIKVGADSATDAGNHRVAC